MKKPEFSQFYTGYIERIYKFVYFRVGGNKELAQDLTQDIFLKAFEAFDRYDPAISQTSWLYTIARHHVINHHAKQRPGATLDEIEGSLSASEDSRERFAEREDERALLKAMGQIPAEDAKLLQMKYLEGWSFDELSEVMEKKSGALRVQARRAIKKLKPFIKYPYAL